jgi:hypothetical protein
LARDARAIIFCVYPDEVSNASGRKWLLASGQRRASAAGSGFRNREAFLAVREH